MHRTILPSLTAFCLVAALLCLAGPVMAEPEAPTEPKVPAEPQLPAEPEDPDATLVQSLLGMTYSGDLPIEGWDNFGGGLVAPPIYVHLYQREDGSSLVVTSRLSSEKYVVTDALIISKPWKGYAVSIACMQGDDFTLRFIGDARGPDSAEWWTEVRRAWAIELVPKPQPATETETKAETAETIAEPAPAPQPGKIVKVNTKGVKCTNPNW